MTRRIITNETIVKFKKHLIMEEKSDATVEKYVRDITAFMKYLKGNTVTKETLIEYKQYISKSGYAVRSINSMIASVNSFLMYAGWFNLKLKSIKIQREIYCSEEKELTKDEYKRLINTAKKKGNKRLSYIIQTICSTGIRVGELEFITVEAIKKGKATVSLKGKTRTVLIVKQLQKKLLRYIAEQKIYTGCIFITRTGKPINRINIWKEMKNLCKLAFVNPNKVFPHNLRHLFARTFYKSEKDLARLADILGHSSINTTRIYIITTDNEHRRCMENMRLII